MVGVPVLITGRITRLGTVSLSGLGSATVIEDGSDYLWSYLATPVSAGSLSTTVTATDSINGSTSTVSITLTVAAAAVYPVGVTPLARFDGAHSAMFSNTGGTVPATVHGTVLRANDVSPLASNWQGPAEVRDPSGIRLEPAALSVPPLKYMGGVGATIALDGYTFVCSWVARYSRASLCMVGSYIDNSLVGYRLNGGGFAFLPGGFVETPGSRHTCVFRFSPTAVKVELWTDGALTAQTTNTLSVAGGVSNSSEIRIGHSESYAYLTLVEWDVINRTLTDPEVASMVAFASSIPCRPAWPIDQGLWASAGDSNTQGVGCLPHSTPKFSVTRALRATRNIEMVCTARVGWGVAGHADFIAPYYDARRKVNIASCDAGTNNFSDVSDAATVVAAYFAELDAMRAQGWKVIACTVQDRNGLFSGSGSHADYRAKVDIFNAAVRAGTSHYDALCDSAAIPQLGADGAADNLTYFGVDKVHLNDVGQALKHTPMLACVEYCYALAA